MNDVTQNGLDGAIWKIISQELGSDLPFLNLNNLDHGVENGHGNGLDGLDLSNAVTRAKVLLEEKLRRCSELHKQLASRHESQLGPTLTLRGKAHQLDTDDSTDNLDLWVKMEFWTVSEGLALAFGLDPAASKEIPPTSLLDEDVRLEYTHARHIATRSFNDNGGLGRKLTPEQFMKWAQSKALSIHPALTEAMERQGFLSYTFLGLNRRLQEMEDAVHEREEILTQLQRRLSGQIEDSDDTFSPRRRRSYLLVIAGLLKKQSIDWTKRAQAQRLCSAVDRIGRSLGDDTARSILKEVMKEVGDFES